MMLPDDPRPWSWRRVALILWLCLLVASCSLCERGDQRAAVSSTTASLAASIPGDANSAAIVPDWKELRNLAQVLDRRFGQKLPVEAGLAEFKRKYGLNLTSVEELTQMGIRSGGGLALARIDRSRVVVLAVDAPALFEKSVSRLARERWEAAEQPVVRAVGEQSITLWVKKGGEQSPNLDNLVVGYALRDGKALIFPGKGLMANYGDPEIVLTKMLRLEEKDSLAARAPLADLQAQLKPLDSILVLVDAAAQVRERAAELDKYDYSKPDAEKLRKTADEVGFFALGVQATGDEVRLRGLLPLKGELLKKVKAATQARADVGPLAGALTGEPVAALKLSVEPKELMALIFSLMESAEEKEAQTTLGELSDRLGVNIQEQLLPTLDGNAVLALYDISALLSPAPTVDLLQSAEATLALGIKDRAALQGHLDKMAQDGGALVTRQEKGAVILYVVGGAARLALGERALVVSGPKVKEEDLVKYAQLQGNADKGAGARLRAVGALQGRGLSALAVDPAAILSALGPLSGGAAPVLEPFSAWSLTAKVEEQGAIFDLSLTFKAQAAPAAPAP